MCDCGMYLTLQLKGICLNQEIKNGIARFTFKINVKYTCVQTNLFLIESELFKVLIAPVVWKIK